MSNVNYFKLEIYPEICCDYCNSIIHNHIDCIVCEKKYTPSSVYTDMSDDFEIGEILECEDCHAQYELMNKEGYIDEFLWSLKVK